MKRGYVGMIQGAYLAGLSDTFKHAIEAVDLAKFDTAIPIDKMIYVAAFQGGVERFVTPLRSMSEHAVDKFIAARLVEPKVQNASVLTNVLSLQESEPAADSRSEGWKVKAFLHDLLAGMENGAAIVNVAGVPTADEVRASFTPDIAQPVCMLLSAFNRSEETLPAPAQTIEREMVDRFKEIMQSDVYQRYSKAHELVEFDETQSALTAVRQKSKDLLSSGGKALMTRKVSVGVISLVPKIVDSAFGKLPGDIAQFAGDVANRFLEDRRKIVVYEFSDWADSYSRSVLRDVLARARLVKQG